MVSPHENPGVIIGVNAHCNSRTALSFICDYERFDLQETCRESWNVHGFPISLCFNWSEFIHEELEKAFVTVKDERSVTFSSTHSDPVFIPEHKHQNKARTADFTE